MISNITRHPDSIASTERCSYSASVAANGLHVPSDNEFLDDCERHQHDQQQELRTAIRCASVETLKRGSGADGFADENELAEHQGLHGRQTVREQAGRRFFPAESTRAASGRRSRCRNMPPRR